MYAKTPQKHSTHMGMGLYIIISICTSSVNDMYIICTLSVNHRAIDKTPHHQLVLSIYRQKSKQRRICRKKKPAKQKKKKMREEEKAHILREHN